MVDRKVVTVESRADGWLIGAFLVEWLRSLFHGTLPVEDEFLLVQKTGEDGREPVNELPDIVLWARDAIKLAGQQEHANIVGNVTVQLELHPSTDEPDEKFWLELDPHVAGPARLRSMTLWATCPRTRRHFSLRVSLDLQGRPTWAKATWVAYPRDIVLEDGVTPVYADLVSAIRRDTEIRRSMRIERKPARDDY